MSEINQENSLININDLLVNSTDDTGESSSILNGNFQK